MPHPVDGAALLGRRATPVCHLQGTGRHFLPYHEVIEHPRDRCGVEVDRGVNRLEMLRELFLLRLANLRHAQDEHVSVLTDDPEPQQRHPLIFLGYAVAAIQYGRPPRRPRLP